MNEGYPLIRNPFIWNDYNLDEHRFNEIADIHADRAAEISRNEERTLRLSKNVFKTIPIVTIVRFGNITVLVLTNNQIIDIPDDIYILVNLKGLYINNNKIVRVSPKIRLLTNLKWLDISRNPELSVLPTTLKYLTKLETLDLRYTALPISLRDFMCVRNRTWQLPEDINVYFGTPCRRACYYALWMFRELGIPRDMRNLIVKNFLLPSKDYETEVWFK